MYSAVFLNGERTQQAQSPSKGIDITSQEKSEFLAWRSHSPWQYEADLL